jgi:NarL family two-component system sensor histidine kinase LiaS
MRETLVRIAREAVTNAARHARANSISVELTDGAVPVLRVADDGVGFDPDEGRAAGYGLDNIRERADQIGAALRINSRHGRGTEIEVEIR